MMTKKYEILSKREYAAPNSVRYVWLKEYTLIKRGEKKFAVIRFSNDLDIPLERIFFTLEQIDSNGELIDIPEDAYSLRVELDAGISFEKEFAISKDCATIAVKIQKIRAGGKEYCLENNQMTIVTNDELTQANVLAAIPGSFNQKRTYWKLIGVSVIAAIIVLGINILFALFQS